nr:MAG TPA: major capsid protein [Caudoviricetes sp.]
MTQIEKWIERQQEITNAADAQQRGLTAEEQTEFNTLQRCIDDAIEEREAKKDTKKKGEEQQEKEEGEEDPKEKEKKGSGSKGRAADTGFTREWASEIIRMCRSFGIEADEYIERGLTVEAARTEVMQTLMSRNVPVGTIGITDPLTGVRVTNDERTKIRSAMTDGILLRENISIEKPAEGAEKYRALSIRDIAVDCLEMEQPGRDYRHMNSNDLYEVCQRSFYNPEAAFPSILDEAINKSYVQGFEKAKVTFDQWCKLGTLKDFKKSKNHDYIMGYGGDMPEVGENGELKQYVPKDAKMPERQLKTYGVQFTMTRQAFIDDDIGLLVTMPQRYAAKSQQTQNRAVYRILLENKKIHDGKALFSTERGNTLATGTDVLLKSVQKMIYLAGIQKDETGDDIALVPDTFIVPFGLGVAVNTLLSSPVIHTAENTQAINPYAKMPFNVVEDVTLNSLSSQDKPIPWFMGCAREIIQVDYLNGQRIPTIRRSEKPGTLGFVWDVYHDWGISVIHPQCIVRNPGVRLNLGE